MRTTPTTTSNAAAPTVIPLKLGLTFLLALQAAGAWLPATGLPPTWLWGLNHLAWFPPAARVAIPLCGLVLVWGPPGRAFGSLLLEKIGPRILGSRVLAFGVVPLFGAVALWLFRDRVHLLGDGQTLATLMARNVLFHGFDFMTYFGQAWIFQWSGTGQEPEAYQIMTAVSCLAGLLYLAVAAWSARRLGTDSADSSLLYALLIWSAPLQLFMGYAETYAPLAVGLLVFLTLLLLYTRHEVPLWKVGCAWAVALFLHLNALFLGPLLAAVTIWPGPRKSPFVRRLAAAFLPAFGTLVVAAGLYLLSGYSMARWRADFGSTLTGGGIFVPWSGHDGLLTPRHLKDVINLLLLLGGPCLIVAATSGFPLRVPDDRRRGARLLAFGVCWLIVLTVTLHMKLGTARDWDLLAAHAAVFTLAGWWLLGDKRRLAVAGPVLGTALALSTPWFLVNADPARAVARVDAVTADVAPYPRGLLQEQIAHLLLAQGDQDGALQHFRRAGEVCPNNPRFHSLLGTFLLNRNDLDGAAAAYARTLRADSLDSYGLKMGLLTADLRQDQPAALSVARRLQRLGLQDADAAEIHARAAAALNHPTEAREALVRSLAQDPRRTHLWNDLGRLDLAAERFAEAAESYRNLLNADPQSVRGRLGLGVALWRQLPTARQARAAQLQQILALIDGALATGLDEATDHAEIADWRSRVLSALAEVR